MTKTLKYYLSKGYDKKTAEYFLKGKRTIKTIKPNDDYSLLITFDNGEQKLFDVAPLIEKGGIFTHIQQIEIFRRVYLDNFGCHAWDINPNINGKNILENKIDIAADRCYIEGIPVKDI